jgi:hypothetical protein
MMRTRILITAVAAFLSVGALRSPLGAQATTVCKDGTTSTASGRGACSGHGGVDSKATAAAKKTAAKTAKKADVVPRTEQKTAARKSAAATATPTPPPAAAPTPATKSAAKTTPARTKSESAPKATTPTQQSSKRGEDNDPTGAIAQCKDGMYSHAANRRGACSRHGGVGKWLKEP